MDDFISLGVSGTKLYIHSMSLPVDLLNVFLCVKHKETTKLCHQDTISIVIDHIPGQLSHFSKGVMNGLCEHLRACRALRFFASTNRNKKFALRACEQRKNLGSTSRRALV